jgi:hypothetical protein
MMSTCSLFWLADFMRRPWGRRRVRLATGFGCAVGRTSPPCQAVRSPLRNSSSVGPGFASGPGGTTLSAIATRRCWAERISLSRRTGSRVACSAVIRSRTPSEVRGSASSRWAGVAGGWYRLRTRTPSRCLPASLNDGWKKLTNSRTVA